MVKEGASPPVSAYADFFNPLKEQELFSHLQQAIVFSNVGRGNSFFCWQTGMRENGKERSMNQTDRIYDLSMIWSKVNDIFPYFERLTFDWNDLYLRYIPQILAAEDEQTFHDLLTSFVDSLQDGHTKYIPPAEYRRSKPYVPPAAPSFVVSADGVFTVKINDFMHDYAGTVREYLEKYPEITKVCIDVRDNVGGNTIYGAKIAELFIPGEFHACQKWTRIQKGIDAAVASQTANMSEATIKRYLAEGLMTEEGVQKDAKIRTGTYYETYIDSFGAPGNKALFQGPVELLTSRRTISAAEDFVAMFKSNRRATIIGEPTFGSTGSPCLFQLRCGGRAQVVSVGYRLLDGTEFINVGIQPDVCTERIPEKTE